MPEHIRALVVVLALFLAASYIAGGLFAERLAGKKSFALRRVAWITVTLVLFLAPDFWIYCAIAAALLYLLSRRDINPLGFYCALLFVAPPFEREIPGIGPIDHFFALNHYRLLNLCVLLPFAIRLRSAVDRSEKKGNASAYNSYTAWLILYLFVVLVQHTLSSSITDALRQAFYLFVDIWLPFYVASRGVRDMAHLREVANGFLLGALAMALIGVFETTKYWLLYESLRAPLGVPAHFLGYLGRGDLGTLRAAGSFGSSIALGYVLTVAIGFLYALWFHKAKRILWVLTGLLLAGGLVASLSRGPWVGFAGMVLVLLLLRKPLSKKISYLVGTTCIVAVILVSPLGNRIVPYLPFVGSVDEFNVDYRARLIDVSYEVFWRHPLFGRLDFMNDSALEEMRQGQGIIDIVNTYIQVALPYGAVGLLLFLLALFMPAVGIYRRSKHPMPTEVCRFGRSLLAITVATGITIGTVSSIAVIPIVYWLIAGLSVAWLQIVSRHLEPAKANRGNSSYGVSLQFRHPS